MFKRLLLFRGIQICMDLLLVYTAFLGAYFMRVGWVFSSDLDFMIYAGVSFLAGGLWILFLIFTKYYRIPPRSGKKVWFDVFLTFLGGGVGIAFLLVGFFFQEIYFSRLIVFYAFLFGSGGLLLSQLIFRWILVRQKKQGKQVYKTLIVGANRVAEQLIKSINNDSYALYTVIGVIDPYGISKSVKGSEILGKLNKLESVCKNKGVTAIIQCDAFEHTLNIISFCEEYDIKFQFDPALRGIYENNLRIREVAGQSMISFVKRDFDDTQKNKKLKYKWGDFILRQVFDID